MYFVAIDFETFDQQRDSACAVGLVGVEGRRIVDRRKYLIRPPRQKAVAMLQRIHGISWSQVAKEPTWEERWPAIRSFVRGAQFLVAHNAGFDRSVLTRCCDEAGLRVPNVPMICTMRLARNAWGLRPTTLPDVCDHLGLRLEHHHDALSDAEACARIVLAAGAAQVRRLLDE